MQAAAHISEGVDGRVERLRLRLQTLLHDSAGSFLLRALSCSAAICVCAASCNASSPVLPAGPTLSPACEQLLTSRRAPMAALSACACDCKRCCTTALSPSILRLQSIDLVARPWHRPRGTHSQGAGARLRCPKEPQRVCARSRERAHAHSRVRNRNARAEAAASHPRFVTTRVFIPSLVELLPALASLLCLLSNCHRVAYR